MKTLRNIAVGETAKVKRLHGEGALKAPYHGYGNYKRQPGLCTQGGSTW